MVNVRLEGTEEEVREFIARFPEIPGYKLIYERPPKIGNNPKYSNSKKVECYRSYKKEE